MASWRSSGDGIARASVCVALLALSACSSSGSNGAFIGPDASFSYGDASLSPGLDAATSQDAASFCAPASVQGYEPTWIPPKAPESVCSPGNIDAYAACLESGSTTSSACTSWYVTDGGATSACRSCLADSKATDSSWGPLLEEGTSGAVRQVNVSGCLSIVLHDTGAGCAGSFEALQQCESAACADDCEGDSTLALVACVGEADLGGCANFVESAACVLDAGAAADGCFGPDGGTFGQKFAAVAAVFCQETDAGDTGGAGAPRDASSAEDAGVGEETDANGDAADAGSSP